MKPTVTTRKEIWTLEPINAIFEPLSNQYFSEQSLEEFKKKGFYPINVSSIRIPFVLQYDMISDPYDSEKISMEEFFVLRTLSPDSEAHQNISRIERLMFEDRTRYGWGNSGFFQKNYLAGLDQHYFKGTRKDGKKIYRTGHIEANRDISLPELRTISIKWNEYGILDQIRQLPPYVGEVIGLS